MGRMIYKILFKYIDSGEEEKKTQSTLLFWQVNYCFTFPKTSKRNEMPKVNLTTRLTFLQSYKH